MPSPSAEEQISAMLFAVLLLDENLTVTEANHAAENMLGCSIKRLCGMPVTQACGIADEMVERLVKTDRRLVARSVSIAPGGYARRVNLTVSPLTTHSSWRVMTLSDAGQDDMQSDYPGRSALQAPAILAHEIKNPLAAIKGASQLLSRQLDGAGADLVAIINDEVARIAALVDRMQELGSETGSQVGAVNLHQTTRKAMASIRSANGFETELAEQFDPSLPPVRANAEALMQVIINLLSNAVAACAGEPAPRISVRTRFVSGLARMVGEERASLQLPVELAVCDNGPGLDPAVADHVFEPFVTSKTNGQGLGLALVKKLVGDMSGRVSHLRNTERGITEFRVHLAIAEGE